MMKRAKFASMLAVAGGLAMATSACSESKPVDEQPAATPVDLADDGTATDNCAAAPCAAGPCAARECSAKPCAATECGAKPCAAKPCAAKK
jgi:hypothetical protein